MVKTSSSKNFVNRGILLLLGASIVGLYIGVQFTKHPDIFGVGGNKTDAYESADSTKQSSLTTPKNAMKLAAGVRALTAVSVPLARPDIEKLGLSYDLPLQAEAGVIPAIFIPTMPNGIETLSVQDRKQLFLRIMLPLILSANETISAERAELAQANRDVLEPLAKKYRLEPAELSTDELRRELDKRIRPIPVSLALAQAAIESGWGTSRFTKEANALYGQWAWRAEDGVKPREASNSRAVIRKFDTLQASVHSYMKNLNSHYAYDAFRDGRAALTAKGEVPDGLALAKYLTSYAETGDEYVETIRSVINRNKFDNFDLLSLSNAGA